LGCAALCSQAAQGGLYVRPANGLDALERSKTPSLGGETGGILPDSRADGIIRSVEVHDRLLLPWSGLLSAEELSLTHQSHIRFHSLLTPDVVVSSDNFLLTAHNPVARFCRIRTDADGLEAVIRGPLHVRWARGYLP